MRDLLKQQYPVRLTPEEMALLELEAEKNREPASTVLSPYISKDAPDQPAPLFDLNSLNGVVNETKETPVQQAANVITGLKAQGLKASTDIKDYIPGTPGSTFREQTEMPEDVYNRLHDRYVKEQEVQTNARKDMEDLIRTRALASTAQTDLSPLMALADEWTGSHLNKSYKAPETPEQYIADKAGLMKLKNNLIPDSKDLAAFIRANLMDKVTSVSATPGRETGSIKIETPPDKNTRKHGLSASEAKQLEALNKRLQDVNAARSAINEFKDGIKGKKDIPGVGSVEGTQGGLWNFVQEGGEKLGLFAKGGVENRSKLTNISNLTTKAISGTRATDKDFERAMKGMGSGESIAEEVIRSRIDDAQKRLDNAEADIRGGYTQNIVDLAYERAGQEATRGTNIAPRLNKNDIGYLRKKLEAIKNKGKK